MAGVPSTCKTSLQLCWELVIGAEGFHQPIFVCYAMGMVSQYQSNPGLAYWIAVKHIFKYLRRTRNYMLM